ncbi:MAG: WD40 repeat domain-containing protein [Bacteroidetes bacterium]|nr:WD40 repeat domain-containing protein [Bacteroidota bacterium]
MIYSGKLRNFFLVLFAFVTIQTLAQEDESLVTTLKEHTDQVHSVAFSPDGKQFISGSKDEKIILWNFETFEPVKTIQRHYATIYELEYSTAGDLFFSGGDKTVNVWQNDGTYIKSLSGHTTAVWSIGLSADAKFMVSGSFDNDFRLWDVAEGSTIHIFENNRKSVMATAYSKATNLIASGSQNGYIDIYTFDNFELIHTFPAHSGNVYALAFSHNGKYLASASREGTIKIWDLNTMNIIHVLTNHERSVMSIQFSSNDKLLVSGSYDATVKLWDVVSGKEIHTYVGHTMPVNDVAIRNDNKYILSASSDKTIKVWKLKPELLVNFYFKDEYQQELEQSDLFDPKRPSESRSDYKERQLKADAHKQILLQKYVDRLNNTN